MDERTYTARDWNEHPPYRHEGYRSTALRAPTKPLVPLAETLSELTGPVFGHSAVGPLDADLTKNGAVNGAPLGERIVVAGRTLSGASEGSDSSTWVLEQPEVLVRNARLAWTDELRGAPTLELSAVDLVVRNSGDSHKIALRATPPEDLRHIEKRSS